MAALSEDETQNTVSSGLELNPRSSVITDGKLRQLYSAMLRARFGAADRASSFSGKGGPFALQEASVIGCMIDLRAQDTALTLIHQNVEMVWGSGMGAANRANGDAGRGAAFPTVVALKESPARIDWATGIALLHGARAEGSVVLVFALAQEINRSRDSLQFAHERRLPILYVQLELSSRSKQRRTTIRGLKIPAIPVDKADAVAVYRVASEAIDKARRGAGPSLIQCISYSQRKTPSRDNAQARDPLVYMEDYLRKKRIWSEELRSAVPSHGAQK